jgi:hypothetical protein
MRVLLLALITVVVAPAAAIGSPEDQNLPRQPPTRQAPDFLFGRPDGSVTVRGSWFFSRAGSDWYDFVTEHLTLENSDFDVPAIGVDVGITLTNRAEVLIGFDYGQTTTTSEYRDFVDNFRLPIEQTTRLREFNISGGVKYALTERGREVGNFAWVPRTAVPYVGAGVGVMRFDVRQFGDFVDFVDSSIFSDVFAASGWTPSAHVLGGVDVRVFRRLFLTVEGRYLWAAGELGSTWVDFDPIDLTGARVSAGINLVF